MEILKDKKVLIGVGVLAILGFWYWNKNKKKETPVNPRLANLEKNNSKDISDKITLAEGDLQIETRK